MRCLLPSGPSPPLYLGIRAGALTTAPNRRSRWEPPRMLWVSGLRVGSCDLARARAHVDPLQRPQRVELAESIGRGPAALERQAHRRLLGEIGRASWRERRESPVRHGRLQKKNSATRKTS